MIHHVSIPAREPQHVAEVLAELMNGRCVPFSPLEGAFMAMNGDEHGSMIEVYPERATLEIPRDDDQVVFGEHAPPRAWPFHLLLSVPRSVEEIEEIGARAGWRTKLFGRGIPGQKPFFHVIELWIENRLMIEVASPEMAEEYTNCLRSPAMAEIDPAAIKRMQDSYRRPAAG
jgi:hypothetical protein